MLKSKLLSLLGAGILSVGLIAGSTSGKTVAQNKPAATENTANVKHTHLVSGKSAKPSKQSTHTRYASKKSSSRHSSPHVSRTSSRKHSSRHSTYRTSSKHHHGTSKSLSSHSVKSTSSKSAARKPAQSKKHAQA